MAYQTDKQNLANYSYAPLQDMLFVEFEPVAEDTFYVDVPNFPDVMLRYTIADERLVGISMEGVSEYLGIEHPDAAALKKLAFHLLTHVPLQEKP